MYCGPPHQLSQALCSGELAGMCPWALGLQCLSWSGSLYFSTLPIQWYIASLTTLLLGLKLFRGLLLVAQQSKNLWNHLQSLPHAWATSPAMPSFIIHILKGRCFACSCSHSASHFMPLWLSMLLSQLGAPVSSFLVCLIYSSSRFRSIIVFKETFLELPGKGKFPFSVLI